jgi:hypothetical protein
MKVGVASARVSCVVMESVPFLREYPYSRVLDEIVQAAHAGTELGPYGFLPTDPVALCKRLEQRKLTLCSGFVEVRLADRSAAEATGPVLPGLLSQQSGGSAVLAAAGERDVIQQARMFVTNGNAAAPGL